MSERFLDACGWLGGGTCLLAYGLMTQQLLASTSYVFLGMNGVGCVALIYYTYRKGAFANAALNSVHLTITIVAACRRLFEI